MKVYLLKKHRYDLQLVEFFENIIRENKVEGFISFGSLIGTIRHNGFIPWDDDVDYAVNIKDREKLKNSLNEFCTNNDSYYFQNTQGTNLELFEPDYFGQKYITRYSDERFEVIEPITLSNKIDIFYYAYLDDDQIIRLKKLHKLYSFVSTTLRIKPKNNVKKIAYVVFRKLYSILKKRCEKLQQEIIDSQDKTIGKKVYFFDYLPDITKHSIKEIDAFISHKFEDIMVTIPKNYDEILSSHYGNYMVEPENKCLIHEVTDFDDSLELLSSGKINRCKVDVCHVNDSFATFVFSDYIEVFASELNTRVYKMHDNKSKLFINDIVLPLKLEINNVNDFKNVQYIGNVKINISIKNNILEIY